MTDINQRLSELWKNWKIEKIIGEGSFGKVYKIVRTEYGKTYDAALKVIEVPKSYVEVESVKNDGMDDKSVTLYFQSIVEDIVDEVAIMSKLKGNSNIVSYEDHAVVKKKDEFGWEIYIRMELLTPLFKYIKGHTLTIRQIINLGIDMCKALEVCQKYNIIHRDIKPENIFVSNLGQFKLGDFGISKQLEKTNSALSKKGASSYMAPEVYKGEKYGSNVDIYSLGMVLYRFLNNNRIPFVPPYPQPIKYSDQENANIMRISGKELPPPCNANGRLAEIILKACAYNPEQRYNSPENFRNALEEVLNLRYTQSIDNTFENEPTISIFNMEATNNQLNSRNDLNDDLFKTISNSNSDQKDNHTDIPNQGREVIEDNKDKDLSPKEDFKRLNIIRRRTKLFIIMTVLILIGGLTTVGLYIYNNQGNDVQSKILLEVENNTLTLTGTGEVMEADLQGSLSDDISNIVIGNGITNIGKRAFRGANVSSVEISDTVTSIGEEAFNECKSLNSIIIPDSVVNMEEGAFKSCTSLSSIKLSENISEISDYLLTNCGNLSSIELPDKIEKIGRSSFYYCKKLRKIKIPDNVIEIEDAAFENCNCLVNVEFGNKLKNIGRDAFCCCKKLKNISFPDSLEMIKGNAFMLCTGLETVTMGENLTDIMGQAFFMCENLTSVSFEKNIEKITSTAFNKCKQLTIYGYTGTMAEEFAKKHRINFQAK